MLLTFPGAFAPDGLLGAGSTRQRGSAYFWRAAPPIAIILYVLLKRTDSAAQPVSERPPARIAAGVLQPLSWRRGDDPDDSSDTTCSRSVSQSRGLNYANSSKVYGALIALLILALAVLFPNRKSVLDLWLLVALSGWLAHALLNLQATAPFHGQLLQPVRHAAVLAISS